MYSGSPHSLLCYTKSTSYILHFTFYILHPTFYILHPIFCIYFRFLHNNILHSSFYILHPTSYILHSAFYILHLAFYPTSYILHPASYILHLAYYILHPTSYILHPTSCIILHSKSYLLHPTFYILYPTSCILSHILNPTSYILHPTSYIRHPASYILHPTSYILHPISYIEFEQKLFDVYIPLLHSHRTLWPKWRFEFSAHCMINGGHGHDWTRPLFPLEDGTSSTTSAKADYKVLFKSSTVRNYKTDNLYNILMKFANIFIWNFTLAAKVKRTRSYGI
jgi:hypothetical protein